MYLKEIRTHGFKSFADKVNIELGTGITGIVGPNGSGKSNVVDAVRWVLGEQSVKSLRGDGNMTDVIFSGSKSRKPQNVASVSLIFDNSDNYLPLSFHEVALKRRVYKDGTNEYFINGEKCRLKDIVTILLDSGMAKESFNIISQGKIDEILLSKPTDRRVIFEEAAGVLKYKRRKEDALRKLERTHDNMSRVGDIIKELEERVTPLKEQKEKALLYEKTYEELKEIDLSVLVYDVQILSASYKENKQKIEQINTEILGLNSSNSKGEAEVSIFKNKLTDIETLFSLKQKELLVLTGKVEKYNSSKKILLERRKYEVEDTKLHSALIGLKEEEAKLQNQIASHTLAMDDLKKDMKDILEKARELEKRVDVIKEQKRIEEQTLSKTLRLRENMIVKIEALQESIETNSSLPYAVKAILENIKLVGIHNVIGNLIEVEEAYTIAISTSLGFAATNIITDHETAAKEAIAYLKQNNLGRSTFFPMNIIESRKLTDSIVQSLQKQDGFIGVASELVKFDPKYRNIIENQLGTVIVARDIDSANKISTACGHKLKIVTLDGELLHIGGSITGGKQKTRNMLSDKYDLENYMKEEKKLVKEMVNIENKINEIDESLKIAEDKTFLVSKDAVRVKESIHNKENTISLLTQELEKATEEIKGAGHILENTLDQEEEKVIAEYYAAERSKVELENELGNIVKEKKQLQDQIEEYEFEMKRENSLFFQKNKELTKLEIEVGREDVKLDNALSYLTETYNMTYENASLKYRLEMDLGEARDRIVVLKRKIKEIGPVNVDAKEEYDRISERYEFLIGQRDDLVGAENTLLDIIKEMDEVMIREFTDSFHLIAKNFKETFTELFKGGFAKLTLTDPDNILETGVEIVASPPGKSLKSISLLSGGEKTFTAISLLFAILKSRPVPFCILDEVEAALDEANVESFGHYLTGLKEKTQFILITHKKKTMEFADVLYGITMQESGVSKLVSVRLEELR